MRDKPNRIERLERVAFTDEPPDADDEIISDQRQKDLKRNQREPTAPTLILPKHNHGQNSLQRGGQ